MTRVRAIALNYRETVSPDRLDLVLGQKPVDQEAGLLSWGGKDQRRRRVTAGQYRGVQ
jgi:hypothetical protein